MQTEPYLPQIINSLPPIPSAPPNLPHTLPTKNGAKSPVPKFGAKSQMTTNGGNDEDAQMPRQILCVRCKQDVGEIC